MAPLGHDELNSISNEVKTYLSQPVLVPVATDIDVHSPTIAAALKDTPIWEKQLEKQQALHSSFSPWWPRTCFKINMFFFLTMTGILVVTISRSPYFYNLNHHIR